MKLLPYLLPLLLCCCTQQNQLILDPFDRGESLMVCDMEAISAFESLMADVATPANEHQLPVSPRAFFDSSDVISTYQFTQPILGICRNGEKQYYYHIEKDTHGTLLTDLDLGVTDYVVSPEKYEKIKEFIALHSPVQQEDILLEEGLNESDYNIDNED